MIMNADDKRRYEWLRQQFTHTELQADGTYVPFLPSEKLVPAWSLDESIDLVMGVTPTHTKLEEMVPLRLCVELLMEQSNFVSGVWSNGSLHAGIRIRRRLLHAPSDEELSVVIESVVRELAAGSTAMSIEPTTVAEMTQAIWKTMNVSARREWNRPAWEALGTKQLQWLSPDDGWIAGNQYCISLHNPYRINPGHA